MILSGPLRPGESWGAERVAAVLCWGRRGGLYRLQNGKVLKEVALPEKQSEQRRAELEEALRSWQGLQPPHAVRLEAVQWREDRVFLTLPWCTGTPASLWRPDVLPSAAELTRWAEQLLDLVSVLQRVDHALAFSALQPDHLMVAPDREILVFNPGWSQLAQFGATTLRHRPLPESVREFARCLLFLAGNGQAETLPTHLSPALLWVLGRCLGQQPGQTFASFQEVRLSLARLPLKQQERVWTAGAPTLTNFTLPSVEPPPPRRGGGLRWWWLAPLLTLPWLPARRAEPAGPAALVVAQGRQLEALDVTGRVTARWKTRGPIQSMQTVGDRIYFRTSDDPALWTVRRGDLEVRRLPLQLSPQGLRAGESQLFSWQSGRILVFQGEQLRASVPAPEGLRDLAPGPSLLGLTAGQLVEFEPLAGGVEHSAPLTDGLEVCWSDSGPLVSRATGHIELWNQELRRVRGVQAGVAPIQLVVNPYRRALWSLDAEGVVSEWALPGLERLDGVRLTPPLRAADADRQGRLWVVDGEGLHRLESNPLRSVLVRRMDPSGVTGLSALTVSETH